MWPFTRSEPVAQSVIADDTTMSTEMTQPKTHQPMDPQKPQPDDGPLLNLRGGNRGGPCPGRFCFIVPCPLPCDCCVI
ncbi:hypothetical protein BKA59DRAFT_484921 [Fusarium tricinctum]|uniref:Uncharacterized protein n=1 Tax=Fusarium tricinctum TaxID=61284 RepID=A0A8K0RMU8_9HYPO|nr:hypothetical protein BKA59DRAFT_484921 [Fusarium tricinctum]